jgi:AraC family transcriptional regulator, regulatory protein of adaptative response / DNA-3-methyladenine glycosylase II
VLQALRLTCPKTASHSVFAAYHSGMESDDFAAEHTAYYNALLARDSRFDGRFFTAVKTTGIYCRPVCKVRAPKQRNCVFFGHAAQAEQAGFRPCLRCRPELAPHSIVWSTQEASYILAHQAARLLDEPQAADNAALSVEGLAARLGVSSRHVRRIFEAQLGVSPLQYVQTRRLHTAKQLLTDTDLAVTQVAFACGFASVRRFNAAFLQHYRLNPTALRKQGRAGETTGHSSVVKLSYRPPYDAAAMLRFFSKRLITGVDAVDGLQYSRTLRVEASGAVHRGWLVARFDELACQLHLQVSDSLLGVLPLVIHRVRACFDLDADPNAINAVLSAHFPAGDALRVPGTLDGYELAVRAVLGQQITVAAARTASS